MTTANLYPAFQFIFEVAKTDNVRQTCLKMHGAEVLSRSSVTGSSFKLPEDWTWREVDFHMAQLLKENASRFPVTNNLFVNVSEDTLSDIAVFFRWLGTMAALKNTGAFSNIVIEITEDITPATLQERWIVIKDCGFKLAMDDYGIAFSNVERLQNYAWDYCKLDMSVISDRELELAAEYCIKNNIAPIAEKIENSTAKNLAVSHGVMLQQGYFYCRPITKDITKKESFKCSKVS